mgnify:CR=1 FL=1
MKTVNLRDFYQSIYDHDCLYEVPDEVAELLILYKRREEAHRRLTYKYRAYFSLDCCDGIENEAVIHHLPRRSFFDMQTMLNCVQRCKGLRISSLEGCMRDTFSI